MPKHKTAQPLHAQRVWCVSYSFSIVQASQACTFCPRIEGSWQLPQAAAALVHSLVREAP